jgi:hypothetical protein
MAFLGGGLLDSGCQMPNLCQRVHLASAEKPKEADKRGNNPVLL